MTRHLVLALLLAACGEPFSNAPFDADARYLAAVPRAQALRMAGPPEGSVGVSESALTAEPAELYTATRYTTLNIDRAVIGQLRAIEALVERPPTVRGPDQRTWGPYRDALDPVESRFVMREIGDGFEYQLEQFRVVGNAGAPAETPIVGGFTPDGEADGDGHGWIQLDLDARARVAGTPGRGHASVAYDRRGGRIAISLTLEDFAEYPGAAPQNAAYFYTKDAAGVGELEWAFIGEDAETVELRSRWRRDGAGRVDARVTAVGGPPVILTECWDAHFARVYYADQVNWKPAFGDAADCAFPEVALPEHVTAPGDAE